MPELSFHVPQPDEYDLVYPYTSIHGNGSCQHSFVSMYALFEKYGDCICEEGGFLYTLRSHLCDEQYRTYLAPMGSGNLRSAFRNILDDAHRYGKKVRFITLTEEYARFAERAFPGAFTIQEDRDLAEYVYDAKKLSDFPGKEFKKRRQEVNKFWAAYGARASVTKMTAADIADVLAYEEEWVHQNSETHDASALEREARSAVKMLRHFEKFHIIGIVLRIDGRVRGFTFGTRLNDDVFDDLLEKGDRNILNINKILRMELAKQCALDYTYENLEEDLGIPGLRNMKMFYQPEFLLSKYVATEK